MKNETKNSVWLLSLKSQTIKIYAIQLLLIFFLQNSDPLLKNNIHSCNNLKSRIYVYSEERLRPMHFLIQREKQRMARKINKACRDLRLTKKENRKLQNCCTVNTQRNYFKKI